MPSDPLNTLNAAVAIAVSVPCVVLLAVGLQRSTPTWRGIAAGSCVMLAGVGLAALFAWNVRRKETEVKKGWNLKPIVVAADQIAAGAVLTFDMISQRPLPEQFVPTSYVTPAEATEIVGKRVINRVEAGDPITWVTMGKGVVTGACPPRGAGPSSERGR